MKKKILLAVILILILLGIGGAYAYYGTDIFKTDKQVFLSYFKNEKAWPDFNNKNLVEYTKKQENTAYTSDGKITFDIPDVEDESMQMLRNINVSLEGKTNNPQKMSEQKITLDMGQGFNVPIQFKRDKETYGIQTGFLSDKIIAVRNEGLKELFKKFDIEDESIPDKIDFDTTAFTEEELKTLSEKYSKLLDDNLSDEMFSKEKKDGTTIIKLKMSATQLTEIAEKILNEVSNDQILTSKMTEENRNQMKESVKELMEKLKDEDLENSTFEMNLYAKSNKVEKCEILFIDGNSVSEKILIENSENKMAIKAYEEEKLVFEMTIEKANTLYTIKAKIYEADEVIAEIKLTMEYKNLEALDNVEEEYNIEVKIHNESNNEANDDEVDSQFSQTLENLENMTISSKITRKVTFSPDLEIEKINKDNAFIINDATDEELQAFIMSIYQRLGLV